MSALRDVAIRLCVRPLRRSRQCYSLINRLDFLVAGAVGFAKEISKFNTSMTTFESPVVALLTTHVIGKAVSIIRSRYGLLRA